MGKKLDPKWHTCWSNWSEVDSIRHKPIKYFGTHSNLDPNRVSLKLAKNLPTNHTFVLLCFAHCISDHEFKEA